MTFLLRLDLLDHGADVNYENELGMTPLSEPYDQLFKSLENIVELHRPSPDSLVVSQTSTSYTIEYMSSMASSFGMDRDSESSDDVSSMVSSSSVDYDSGSSGEMDVSLEHTSEEGIRDLAVTTSRKEIKSTTMALILYDPLRQWSLSVDSRIDKTLEEQHDAEQGFTDEQIRRTELLERLIDADELNPEFITLCRSGRRSVKRIHKNFERMVMNIAKPMESLLQRHGAKTGSGPSI